MQVSFNEEEKNLIWDTLKSPGWKLIDLWNKEAIEEYRRLATQPPEGISSDLRTWFSAKAEGREELINTIVEKVTSSQEENMI